MNEKKIRYIGLGFSVLLTLIILYSGNYGTCCSSFGIIERTIIYDLLRDMLDRDRELAYIAWYICLLSGLWLSWKYRLKSGQLIVKLTTKIHKKV